MSGEHIWRTTSLDDLLTAGREAFSSGDREAAHDLWRAAAVANPYDERVWTSLLEVLVHEDDREVCLENIIAINPLNPDARRQLRALRRERRTRSDDSPTIEAVVAPVKKRRPRPAPAPVKAVPVRAAPQRRPRKVVRQEPERGVLARAILTGILIGLGAVVIGIVASILVYGGVLNLAAF
ncbi:MAG: hypothetical protein U0703_01715 [Anaerolineae bacterium]